MHATIKIILSAIIKTMYLSIIASVSCSDLSQDASSPDICITYNSATVKPGDTIGIHSYSGNPVEIVFTIGNNGSSDLIVENVNSDSLCFSILKAPSWIVKPGGNTNFSLQFFSKEKNNFGRIMIRSNDPATPGFSFNINFTKSNIEVYFSGPDRDTSLEEAFTEMINSQPAGGYLDLCFYGMDSENALCAIESAIERGVHVRFAGDLDGDGTIAAGSGNYYAGYYRIASALDTYFPAEGKQRVEFPAAAGFDDFILLNDSIMHNKFALFTDSAGSEYLFTGSANCTYTDFNLNNNNSLIIQDAGIAGTYREQFEYLLGLPGRSPVSDKRSHVIDGIAIDVMFPPALIEGRTAMSHLLDTVNISAKNIYFMIFSFTHFNLINQLINKHKNGIEIKGIFDESQLANSSEESLVKENIPCRIDGNYFEQPDGHGGKLHHKTMIIDEEAVITGSFNWSYNANAENDENIIILYSAEIAKLYKDEWQKRWDEGTDIVNSNTGSNEQYEYQDAVINEVMWMGSRKSRDETVANDEFIELRNTGEKEINLNGWTIEGARSGGKTLYLEECSIAPYSYCMIMHRDPSASAFKPEKYIVTSGLSISNESLQIVIKDAAGNVIDCAGNGSAGFAGYSDLLKKSMARKETPGDGQHPADWFTTDTQANIGNEYSYALFNLATPGVHNLEGDLGHSALTVAVSEIAWAGTDLSANDEWLELYNNTDADISLAGWSIDGNIQTELYGIIPAHGHFLLERTDDTTVPGKNADLIYTGALGNTGAIIRLLYNKREIDCIDMQAGWAAGSNIPKISMERIDTAAPGSAENWRNGPGDTEGAQASTDF
ncbi:MAG: phospholipase D-like domain-containing protein [Spirochaetota bacterium]